MRRFLTLLSVGCALTGCLSGRSGSQESSPANAQEIRRNADELTNRLRDLVADGVLTDRLAIGRALDIKIGKNVPFNEFWTKSRVEGWLAPGELGDVGYVLAVPDQGRATSVANTREAELLLSLKLAPCVEESNLTRAFRRRWKLLTRRRQPLNDSGQSTQKPATFVTIAELPGKGSVEFRFGTQPKGCATDAYLVQNRPSSKPRHAPNKPGSPQKKASRAKSAT
jgi:hypothetical protein